MIKNSTLLVLSILTIFSGSLNAQITVEASAFPAIGDTLMLATDLNPSIDLGSSGEDLTWDFSSLNAEVDISSAIKAAADGDFFMNFPAATQIQTVQAAEGYFVKTDTEYALIGIGGQDPLGFGADILAAFDPPEVYRNAPLNYGDDRNNTYRLSLKASAEIIPDSIINQLPVQVDSFRLNILSNRRDQVDAWGTVMLPNGTYDALRESRIDIRNTTLEAKLGSLPWFDVTPLVAGIPGFSDLVGADTLYSQEFYGSDSKEKLCVISVGNDGMANNVNFSTRDVVSSTEVTIAKTGSFRVVPNPVIGIAQFQLRDLPSGEYTLKLYNILGVEVHSEDTTIVGDNLLEVDLSNYKKGTYLYSLINEEGKSLGTKRLIVIRP